MSFTTRIVRRFLTDEEIEDTLDVLRDDGCRLVHRIRQPGGTWTIVADCPVINLVGEPDGTILRAANY